MMCLNTSIRYLTSILNFFFDDASDGVTSGAEDCGFEGGLGGDGVSCTATAGADSDATLDRRERGNGVVN